MHINATNTLNGAANGHAAATNGTKTLGQDDFLKLLSVQMQAQDPMNPMADTEFISQMANFTSLEQMKNLTASFSAFISQQSIIGAQAYLGKTVTVLDPAVGPVTGPVSGVTFEKGQPRLLVGDKSYDPALVSTIHAAAAGNTSSATNNSTP
jgi:flagellar basal-body rod modification protein FlgD